MILNIFRRFFPYFIDIRKKEKVLDLSHNINSRKRQKNVVVSAVLLEEKSVPEIMLVTTIKPKQPSSAAKIRNGKRSAVLRDENPLLKKQYVHAHHNGIQELSSMIKSYKLKLKDNKHLPESDLLHDFSNEERNHHYRKQFLDAFQLKLDNDLDPVANPTLFSEDELKFYYDERHHRITYRRKIEEHIEINEDNYNNFELAYHRALSKRREENIQAVHKRFEDWKLNNPSEENTITLYSKADAFDISNAILDSSYPIDTTSKLALTPEMGHAYQSPVNYYDIDALKSTSSPPSPPKTLRKLLLSNKYAGYVGVTSQVLSKEDCAFMTRTSKLYR